MEKVVSDLRDFLRIYNSNLENCVAIGFSKDINKDFMSPYKKYTTKTQFLEDYRNGMSHDFVIINKTILIDNIPFIGLYEVFYKIDIEETFLHFKMTIEEVNEILNRETTTETVEINQCGEQVQIALNTTKKIELFQKAIDMAKFLKDYSPLDQKCFIDFLTNDLLEL